MLASFGECPDRACSVSRLDERRLRRGCGFQRTNTTTAVASKIAPIDMRP